MAKIKMVNMRSLTKNNLMMQISLRILLFVIMSLFAFYLGGFALISQGIKTAYPLGIIIGFAIFFLFRRVSLKNPLRKKK